MRVLVLRPEAEARRIADLLTTRGHDPILAPIIRIAPLPPRPFPGGIAAVAATSANALRSIVGTLPAQLLELPFHCVGSQARAAAQEAGFRRIETETMTARELGEFLPRKLARGTRLLYLTGRPRKPELEAALAAAGVGVVVVETYEARPVPELPEPAIAAIVNGIDIVLHFSRASAQAALHAFERTGTLDKIAMARHLCLSGDIASALVERLDWRIEVAPEPTLEALLSMVDQPVLVD